MNLISNGVNQKLYNAIPDYVKYRTRQLVEPVTDETDDFELETIIKQLPPRGPNNNLIRLFSNVTQHLYTPLARKIPDLKDKKIVITGVVLNDGIGDYQHIICTAEQIKKDYPPVKIDLIPCFLNGFVPKNLKILDSSQFGSLFNYGEAISQQSLEKLNEADIILEISHKNLTDQFEEIRAHKAENYQFIDEYGHFDFSSMGIRNTDLGIMIKETPQSKSLLDLENIPFKQFLFTTAQPAREELENYLTHHEPFVAYVKAGSFYQMAYIYTLVALQEKAPKSVIDVFIPEVDINYLELDYLKKHGIAKIKCVKIDQLGQIIEKEHTVAQEGKEIRFINPYPLNQTDFYTLMLHCNPLVGCTGDHSMSEAFSFNRLPFYEVRGNKYSLWRDMSALAGKVGTKEQYLQKYFEALSYLPHSDQEGIIKCMALGDKAPSKMKEEYLTYFKNRQPDTALAGEQMAKLLLNPEIYQEMTELSEFIKTHFNFNILLKDIIGRHLAINAYPELIEYEKGLYKDFNEGKQDAVQVTALLKKKIDFLLSEEGL
jgi:hypothetical protein